MSLTQIQTLTVFVDDQELARSFYADVLGFEVRTDVTMGDNRWLEVAPPGASTAIVLHRPFPGATAGSAAGTILASSDLDADVARLRSAGVTVDGPAELPWGRQATFTDPDGNGYVLSAAA
jgi:predicted enzyme related to lactoylglutathione lyase